MTKKIFKFPLLAFTASIIPLTSISCSGGIFAKTINKETTIRLGMRAEDLIAWSPIIKSFEKQIENLHNLYPNKYPVAYKIVPSIIGNQKATYSLAGATGMPELSIADPGVATYQKNQNTNWFQPLDPIEFLGKKNNDKYKMFDDQKGVAFSDEENSVGKDKEKPGFFEPSFVPYSSGKTKEGHKKLIALPYQYGPSVILINKLLLDQTQTIKVFMPTNDGVEMIHDTKKLATIKNIKEFIAGAGNKENELGKTITDKRWTKFGPGNLFQRLASIGLSAAKDNAYGWSKDIGASFPIMASGPKGEDIDKPIFKNGMIDDDVLEQIFQENGVVSQEMMAYIYNNQLGYFQNKSKYAIDPSALGQAGEAEVMRDQQALVLLGKKWSRSFMTKGWPVKDTSIDDALVSIPVPYGSANMDALGVANHVKGNKLKACKMFIKLAMSMHRDSKGQPFSYLVARDVAGHPKNPLSVKALPIANAGLNYLKNLVIENKTLSTEQKNNFLAPFNMGKKIVDGKATSNSDEYNGVSGFYASASTKGFQQILADEIETKFENWMKHNKNHLTMAKMNELMRNGIIGAYKILEMS